MSQLYCLKNGNIGHYCDVYKEESVEELAKMPKLRLKNYVSEMIRKPSYFGNEAERLKKALKVIKSAGSSISELNQSLEAIAEIEYSRAFSPDKNVSEPIKNLISKFRGKY